MFTIGRDREKEHSNRYLRNPDHRAYMHRVIDAVHDCLQGDYDASEVRQAFTDGFNKGGEGVWEQTGSWLGKLSAEFPEFSDLWRDLAANKNSKLRFRAAAFLQSMPESHFSDMLQAFSVDRSKMIRSKVAGDLSVTNCRIVAGIVPFLEEWRQREIDPEVLESLAFAIEHQRNAEQGVALNTCPASSSNPS